MSINASCLNCKYSKELTSYDIQLSGYVLCGYLKPMPIVFGGSQCARHDFKNKETLNLKDSLKTTFG